MTSLYERLRAVEWQWWPLDVALAFSAALLGERDGLERASAAAVLAIVAIPLCFGVQALARSTLARSLREQRELQRIARSGEATPRRLSILGYLSNSFAGAILIAVAIGTYSALRRHDAIGFRQESLVLAYLVVSRSIAGYCLTRQASTFTR